MSFPEEKTVISNLLKKFETPCLCIVELGAQTGEDVEWMLESIPGRTSVVFMVEADPINFQKLVGRKLPGGPHLYYNCAVADHNGTCDFWRGKTLEGPQYDPGYGSGFGSIYQPLEGMTLKPEDFTKIEPIPCLTFDTLFRRYVTVPIDLLRADIHGAEKDMIRHGQEALKRTRYLFIEFFDTPTYLGMATRSELLAMLPGWTVIQTFPWNLLLRNDNAEV